MTHTRSSARNRLVSTLANYDVKPWFQSFAAFRMGRVVPLRLGAVRRRAHRGALRGREALRVVGGCTAVAFILPFRVKAPGF